MDFTASPPLKCNVNTTLVETQDSDSLKKEYIAPADAVGRNDYATCLSVIRKATLSLVNFETQLGLCQKIINKSTVTYFQN